MVSKNEPINTGFSTGLGIYAAIVLGVPNSGAEWLDSLIREKLRDEFAKDALQGIVGHETAFEMSPDDVGISHTDPTIKKTMATIAAESAYKYADAMLEARKPNG